MFRDAYEMLLSIVKKNGDKVNLADLLSPSTQVLRSSSGATTADFDVSGKRNAVVIIRTAPGAAYTAAFYVSGDGVKFAPIRGIRKHDFVEGITSILTAADTTANTFDGNSYEEHWSFMLDAENNLKVDFSSVTGGTVYCFANAL